MEWKGQKGGKVEESSAGVTELCKESKTWSEPDGGTFTKSASFEGIPGGSKNEKRAKGRPFSRNS
jgi:hypothetical protein